MNEKNWSYILLRIRKENNMQNEQERQDKIYIVRAISVKEKKEIDLKTEYRKYLLMHNKAMSYEQFIKFQSSWGNDKYYFYDFISSFHLKKDDAIYYMEKNAGDVNESGSYEYGAVVAAPLDEFYYETEINPDTDIILYKYYRENDSYVELDYNEDKELYVYLLYYVWGMHCNQETVKRYIKEHEK